MSATQTMYLPVPLTAEERADLGLQLASAHQELRATKASNKSVMEDLKERHRDAEGSLQARTDELARQVKDGRTWKDVEVSIVRNFESRRLEVTRLDTGERVHDKERDLLPEEYQEQLPLGDVEQSCDPWWLVYNGEHGDRSDLLGRFQAPSAIAACDGIEATGITALWAEPDTEIDAEFSEEAPPISYVGNHVVVDPSARFVDLPTDAELKAAHPSPNASKATVERQRRRAEIEKKHREKNGKSNGKRQRHVD